MPFKLSALNVYPVKGLKGIAVTQARCTERGLEHDRRWMVVDAEDNFLSQRELPKMATIWTEIGKGNLTLSAPDMDPLDIPLSPPPSAPKMLVTVWGTECEALAVSGEADAWLSDYLSMECRFVYMPDKSRRLSNPKYAGEGKLVGFADGYAYLLTSEASLADLNNRLAAKKHEALPMNRFRPKVVVDGLDPARLKAIVDVAIARFENFQTLRAQLADAEGRLEERKLVERAKGLLMKSRKLDEETAYAALRRMAMDRKLKLGEVAQRIIDAADLLGA